MSQGASHTQAPTCAQAFVRCLVMPAIAGEKELFYSRFGFSVILTDCRCAMRVLLQEHPRPRCSDIFGSASPCPLAVRVSVSTFDNDEHK